MYLCDRHIREKLHDLNMQSDDPLEPFDPDTQIQPSSIDLRLSNVFWEPKKNPTIDLRKKRLLELQPRRYWKRRILRTNECITLKPGQLLLGRTCEEFTIPKDCAGKLEGRSSFARMGLGIHCTGDFINPGYRGRMPLEIFNYSLNSIKIFPHIPICQLILVRLSAVPERLYGLSELQSKYMDDDGGPSYWWRDKRINQLQKAFREKDVAIVIQEEILKKIGIQEPEVIERFDQYVEKLPDAHKENADTLLDLFAKNEDKLRRFDRCISGVALVLFPLLGSAAVGIFFVKPYSSLHYYVWMIVTLSFIPFLKVLHEPVKDYLGVKELEKAGR